MTAREAQILGLLASGVGRAAIAEHLYVSPNTVRTHIQHILEKLQVHSSLEAVALTVNGGTELAPGDGGAPARP